MATTIYLKQLTWNMWGRRRSYTSRNLCVILYPFSLGHLPPGKALGTASLYLGIGVSHITRMKTSSAWGGSSEGIHGIKILLHRFVKLDLTFARRTLLSWGMLGLKYTDKAIIIHVPLSCPTRTYLTFI